MEQVPGSPPRGPEVPPAASSSNMSRIQQHSALPGRLWLLSWHSSVAQALKGGGIFPSNRECKANVLFPGESTCRSTAVARLWIKHFSHRNLIFKMCSVFEILSLKMEQHLECHCFPSPVPTTAPRLSILYSRHFASQGRELSLSKQFNPGK